MGAGGELVPGGGTFFGGLTAMFFAQRGSVVIGGALRPFGVCGFENIQKTAVFGKCARFRTARGFDTKKNVFVTKRTQCCPNSTRICQKRD